jgi:hypothetical protein
VLSTNQKGAIAESAVAAKAIRLGIGVWRPYTDERFDFIFDLRPMLIRVQCKCATRTGDVLIVRCYSNRRTRNGMLRRIYTSEEIDAFVAYCAELDKCYFLPLAVFGEPSAIQLRLAPTLNNQRLGVRWARDFEFDHVLGANAAQRLEAVH